MSMKTGENTYSGLSLWNIDQRRTDRSGKDYIAKSLLLEYSSCCASGVKCAIEVYIDDFLKLLRGVFFRGML